MPSKGDAVASRKPREQRPLGALALPGLADPEQMVGMTEAAAPVALARQLKFHLLTCEEIVLSDGFLFDNPALWKLLKFDTSLQSCLLSREAPALTILSSRPHVTESIDASFRTWYFRKEGPVNSSAMRIPWASQKKPSGPASELLKWKEGLTVEQYANFNGFKSLRDIAESIETLLHKARRLQKPSSRHQRFAEHVRFLAERPRSEVSSELSSRAWRSFRKYAEGHADISRSQLATAPDLKRIWPYISGPLNVARMETLLRDVADNAGLKCWYTLPNFRWRPWETLRVRQFSKPSPSFSVLALDELTFTEIARLRSNQRLRESIQAIARTAAADESADGETSPAAAADHVAAVERWGRTLTEAVVEAKLSKRLLPSRGGSLGKLSKARPIFVSAINLGVRLLSHAHLGLGKKALDGASEAARLAFEASLPIAAKFYVRDVGQGLQILVKEVTKATKANVSISA